eukprot:31524-Pelagococcus_subviridis.AAC.23
MFYCKHGEMRGKSHESLKVCNDLHAGLPTRTTRRPSPPPTTFALRLDIEHISSVARGGRHAKALSVGKVASSREERCCPTERRGRYLSKHRGFLNNRNAVEFN